MGVAIVAIPCQDDYTWRVSSEKIPHMTLLFLGDEVAGPELAKIEEFLDHVSQNSLHRFGMDVDHRGELGPDKADVVFFKKNSWSDYKMVKQARAYLLENAAIKAAYNAVEQFPEWTPHLTLGYPETPANPLEKDYPSIGWVRFDKVALWTGDFTGPEFQLKDQFDDACAEVSMSDTQGVVDDILAHHGVKGMQWGVRNEKSGSNRAWKKDASSSATANKAFQNAIGPAMKQIEEINNNPMFKDKDLTKDPVLASQYDHMVTTTFNDHLAQQSIALTLNTKGHAYIYTFDRNRGLMQGKEYKLADAQHADGNSAPDIKVGMNALGHIVSLTVVADQAPVAHTSTPGFIDGFLEHHGVKGMKWGVRKAEGYRQAAERSRRIASGTATGKDKFDQAVLGKGLNGRGGFTSLRPKTATKLADKADSRANKIDAKLEKKAQKQDQKFLKANTGGIHNYIKMHNAVADKMNNGEIDRLNSQPYVKDAIAKDLLNHDTPERARYWKDYESSVNKAWNDVSESTLGRSPSGKRISFTPDENGNLIAQLEDVSHSSGTDSPSFRFIVDKKTGLITRMDKTIMLHEDDDEFVLAHIAAVTFSDKPWGNFDQANYDVEQWHHACLIHNHEGAPEKKGDDKLPVREPNGTLNKNGIHAAASVLAGGMGGVKATDDQKAQAARSLGRFYAQMDEDLPDSVKALIHGDIFDEDSLEHHGVKGMKWGVRKDRPGEVTVGTKKGKLKAKGGFDQPPTEQAKSKVGIVQKSKASGTHSLTNEELQSAITRMNLEQNFHRLVDQNEPKSAGKKFVHFLLGDARNLGRQQANRAANTVATKHVNDALNKRGYETGKKKDKPKDKA